MLRACPRRRPAAPLVLLALVATCCAARTNTLGQAASAADLTCAAGDTPPRLPPHLMARTHSATLKAKHNGRRRLQQASGSNSSSASSFDAYTWGHPDTVGSVSDVLSIKSGLDHAIVLAADGSVSAVGTNNDFGQLTVPDTATSANSATAVAAGSAHSVALLKDGSVVVWGDSTVGQTVVPTDAQTNVKAVSARGNWTLALRSAAPHLVAWGEETGGQLNIPDAAQSSNVTAISAGAYHALALLADDTVVAWGSNDFKQTDVPDEVQGSVAAIAAGGYFSMLLLKNGSIVVFGDNSFGQLNVPPTASGAVTAIAAGFEFGLALLEEGRVVHWGADDEGVEQGLIPGAASAGVMRIDAGYNLGVAYRPSDPKNVKTGFDLYSWGNTQRGLVRDVVAVSGGDEHALALLPDGNITAWGFSLYGQLSVPVDTIGDKLVVAVAAGGNHSLALADDGQVYAWGGETGGESDIPQPDAVPDAVASGGVGAVAIAAGDTHNLALLRNGSVVAWTGATALGVPALALTSRVRAVSAMGDQSAALLANGTLVLWNRTDVSVALPTVISDVSAVSVGLDHVLVLFLNGSVADLGVAATAVPDGATSGVRLVSAGEHSLALRADGRLAAWGPESASDQLRIASSNAATSAITVASGVLTTYALLPPTPEPTVPDAVPAPPSPPPPPPAGQVAGSNLTAWGQVQPANGTLSSVVQACGAELHGLALLADGSVQGWGDNSQGQLDVPTDQFNGRTPSAVSCGGNASFILFSDGSVLGFGQSPDADVAADLQSGAKRATYITSGYTYSFAILDDGTLLGWGYDDQGGLLVPTAAASGVVDVSIGEAHTLALVGDSVVGWGVDLNYQATVPAEATAGVQAVAAGGFHSLALLNSGKVIAWGSDSQGQLQVPDAAQSGVVAIAAGQYHSVALTADGSVVIWGGNDDGQTNMPNGLPAARAIAAGATSTYALQVVSGESPTPSEPGSPPSSPTDTSSSSSSSTSVGAIAGGIAGGVAAIVIAVGVALWYSRRRRAARASAGKLGPGGGPGMELIGSPGPGHRPSDSSDSGNGHATGAAAHITVGSGNGHTVSDKSWPTSLPSTNRATAARAAAAAAASDPAPSIPPGYAVPTPASIAAIRWASMGGTNNMDMWLGGGGGSLGMPPSTSSRPVGTAARRPPPLAVPGGGTAGVSGAPSGVGMSGGAMHIPMPPGSAVGLPSNAMAPGDSMVSGEVTAVMQSRILDGMRIVFTDIAIGGILGEGGFGKVYKGTWKGNRVAVKMLNMDGVRLEAKIMLHQEAAIMCQLHHPSIARVFGLVDEGPHQALVMQYYRRGSLARFMSSLSYQNLGGLERLKIAVQVAGGMCFMHERRPSSVIHGDLKTSNLLLEDDGQRVVIADFGLACRIHTPSAGMQVGALTASISPPEVLINPTAPRLASADVYAFGIVLLEIMLGRPAFPAMRAPQIKQLVCAGGRPPIPETLPDTIRSIITACWAQDALSRPTFAQLLPYMEQASNVMQQIQGHGVTELNTTREEGEETDW